MAAEEETPAAEEDTGLDVDLGQVFDEVTAKDEEPEKEPEPEASKEEDPKEEVEEETVEEEPEPVTAEAEEEEETPAEEPEESVAPPATWTEEAKTKFGQLDPGLQEEILKREKDYAQGIQKHSEAAKSAQSYENIVAPYRAMLASENATPEQAFGELLKTAYTLRSGTAEQRTQLILNLANQYGADLSQLNQTSEEDEYVDPDIKALRAEISSLKQTTQNQIQLDQNRAIQQNQKVIDDFAADKKNVHFEAVRGTMSALIQSGDAATIEEAYEKSLYVVPEVREKVIQEQVKKAADKRIKDENTAAAKAKKAAGLVLQNEEAGIVIPDKGSMEDILGAAFDKSNAS